MGSIWKVILGVMTAVMIVVVGSAILGANNDALNADSFLHVAANTYSESNFNTQVLTHLQEEARKMNYELKLVEQIKRQEGDTAYAILQLNYNYEIPALQVSQEHAKLVVVY